MKTAAVVATGLATIALAAGCSKPNVTPLQPGAAGPSRTVDRPAGTFEPKPLAQELKMLQHEAAQLEQRLTAHTATPLECIRLAQLRRELGDPGGSTAACRSAVQLAPEDGSLRARLASALALAGDQEAARLEAVAAAARGAVLPAPLARICELDTVTTPPKSGYRDARPVSVQVNPPVRVDNALPGYLVAETSITASAQNPLEVLAAWIDYRGGDWRLHYGVSLDGGQTWNDQRLLPPQIPGLEADPMTAYDPATDLMWTGGLCEGGAPGMYVSRRDPGSLSVEPAHWAFQGGSDKGWMAAGPVPGEPDQTRLYLGFTSGVVASSDLGEHWELIQGPTMYKHALMPRVGSDGTLYILSWNTSDTYHIEMSYDGGGSFTSMSVVAVRMDPWIFGADHFPGEYKVRAFGYLAVDPTDSTLYVVYMDTTAVLPDGSYDVDIYFTRSTDGGTSWTTPRILNDDGDPPGDQFFPWIEADAKGRLHALYFDTRRNPLPDDAPTAYIDAYYALSTDGGDTWQEHRLTDTPFAFGTGFLGDYNGLAVAGNRVYAAYPYAFAGTDLDMVVSTVVLAADLPGDLDGDGDVDLADLATLLAAYDTCEGDPGFNPVADIDESGCVDLADLAALLAHYGDTT